MPNSIRLNTGSLSGDRGKGLVRYAEIEMCPNVPFGFTAPHSPLQKGMNGNTNGLLKEYCR